MISIRVRQVEGENDQMISALKNVIERFKIQDVELGKMQEIESKGVDRQLRKVIFDSTEKRISKSN